MTKRKADQLRKTAIHEAGHAVVALALRAKFRDVSIIPDGDSLGCMSDCNALGDDFNPTREVSLEMRSKIENNIMIDLGGICAESVVLGRVGWKWAGADMSNAAGIATIIISNADEITAYIEWLRVKTRNITSMPGEKLAIQRIAEALLEEKRISYKTAKSIRKAAFQEALEAHLSRITKA